MGKSCILEQESYNADFLDFWTGSKQQRGKIAPDATLRFASRASFEYASHAISAQKGQKYAL